MGLHRSQGGLIEFHLQQVAEIETVLETGQGRFEVNQKLRDNFVGFSYVVIEMFYNYCILKLLS